MCRCWKDLTERISWTSLHTIGFIAFSIGHRFDCETSAGETDEVVTIDTKRQIRFPTSLHGKCGLRVTDIPLDRLEPHRKNSFDPLTEGIALSRQKSNRVEIIKDDVVARFDDRIIEGNMGDTIDIHEAGAFFLRLKNWAKKV